MICLALSFIGINPEAAAGAGARAVDTIQRVVLSVVSHLAAHILKPVLAAGRIERHRSGILSEASPQTVALDYDTANRSIGT